MALNKARHRATDRPVADDDGLIGYARVSTGGQSVQRQVDELRKAGCAEIRAETASGADRSRPVLAALLRRIRRGETLVVVKLDRLARSLEHLLEVVRTLEAGGAYLRVLGDPIDTATPQGRFMLQMLGAVAEFERALIRERVTSGLARAARAGRRGGSPGVVARDPDALRRLRHAREDAYRARVTARASDWLPLVVRLRTNEGRTWDDVVRAVNAQAAGQGGRGEGQGTTWTKARLVRAVRALVRDGLAPATVIAARGHQRTAVAQDRQAVVRAVAAGVGENPGATLQDVADRLAALRLYPPRGGTRWSTSTVARIVQAAKRDGLLPASA
jgi:DNA invertase Pin-like site-specific DNA recombinase